MSTAQPTFFERTKKLFVAGVGLAVDAAAAGYLDDRTEAIVIAVVSLLTVLGVYKAKNQLSAADLAAQREA